MLEILFAGMEYGKLAGMGGQEVSYVNCQHSLMLQLFVSWTLNYYQENFEDMCETAPHR